MSIRKVVKYGEPSLREPSKEVHKVSQKIKVLVDDLLDTMYAQNGVGLAAPQVGILKRICVVDVTYEDPIALINPRIIEKSGEQTGSEGCLSYPGKCGDVTRANYVKVEYFDENMEKQVVEGTELLARALQHEIDHLDGHLYTEKVIGEVRNVGEEAEEEIDEIEE